MHKLIRNTVIVTAALGLGGIFAAPAAAQDRQQPETVAQRLDRLERLLNSKGLLDMLQQIQQLQQEVRQLRGDIEVQNHKLEQLSERQRNLYADVDQRLRQLRGGGGATPVENGGGGGPSGGGPPLDSLEPVTGAGNSTAQAGDNLMTLDITPDQGESSSSMSAGPSAAPQTAMAEEGAAQPGSAQDTDIQPPGMEQSRNVSPVQIQSQYQDAFKLLKQSRYEQAIRAFQEFLSAYPNSNYADNAQYWLAEAYYVTRDFEPALREYRKLVQNYPNSQKYTHGMLKIGYTLQELGRLDEAKEQLQKLMQKYPGTTAARLAEERLQRINASATVAPAGPAQQE
jgi:tol-pal system protein YbgF